MARHNRQGRGEDQNGHEYHIDYQPDWLHQVKVTRDLPSGRQSTKTLFRNPDPAQKEPGRRVRTRISAPSLGVDVHVTLRDETSAVRRVTIETVVAAGPEKGQNVAFVLSRKRATARTPSSS